MRHFETLFLSVSDRARFRFKVIPCGELGFQVCVQPYRGEVDVVHLGAFSILVVSLASFSSWPLGFPFVEVPCL